MKPEDINRAIAEHCGWQFLPERDMRLGPQPELWEGPDGDRFFESPFKDWPPYPNYHGDLNAMHEAEKVLFESRPGHYERAWAMALSSVVSARGEAYEEYTPSDLRDVADCAHATHAERAEAFLRTIGKWKESEANS